MHFRLRRPHPSTFGRVPLVRLGALDVESIALRIPEFYDQCEWPDCVNPDTFHLFNGNHVDRECPWHNGHWTKDGTGMSWTDRLQPDRELGRVWLQETGALGQYISRADCHVTYQYELHCLQEYGKYFRAENCCSIHNEGTHLRRDSVHTRTVAAHPERPFHYKDKWPTRDSSHHGAAAPSAASSSTSVA